jgi:predicted dehydrogenase
MTGALATKPVGVAIVGCGNIAAFYFSTFAKHPILAVKGVTDKDPARAQKYSAYYSVPMYESLDALLDDPQVELVINVTNPRSHYAVSKRCLEAGKHVYSEKPMAMSFADASELVTLARQRGLSIASAPSRILAETAQTLWRALRENVVGRVHAVYAEMDGGLIYRSKYKEWMNELGMPWPYEDEFEVGCTIEHAGYQVSWLSAYFGPVDTVTSFATTQYTDVQRTEKLATLPPDLTVACLTFKSGVVARLTTSWLARSDHSLRFFGDTGVLSTRDVWEPKSPVRVTRDWPLRIGPKTILLPRTTSYPFAEPPKTQVAPAQRVGPPKSLGRTLRAKFRHLRKRVDFCLGPAEVAASLREQRPCRLSPEYCLHNTEVVLAINNAATAPQPHKVCTTFGAMEPLSWAQPRTSA